jgi:DNA adenine methylase Dam
MKKLKTPLRYPGGKSRAIKYLVPKFPKTVTEYREPFIGGGSVAIAFTKENPNAKVWVSDLYEPLVNFWQQLQENGEKMTDILTNAKYAHDEPDKAKELFLHAKANLNDFSLSALDRAIYFYIINKCSFSGLTEASSFSAQASKSNFSIAGIERLEEYKELIKNWTITHISYEHILVYPGDENTFIFLDPPYDIKDNLYGNKGSLHKGFDHKLFCDRVRDCKMNWMITYNDNPTLREWLHGYHMHSWDLTYTMRSTGDYMQDQKDRYELLVTNYEV